MHRAGLIDKMTPQVIEEWLAARLDRSPSGGDLGHHVLDQLLHLGYGAAAAATAAPWLARSARRNGGRNGLWRGAALGLGLWTVGTLALFPGLRIARPAHRSSSVENLVNIAAHVLYGVTVQRLVEEPARQPAHGKTSDVERAATRVG